MMMLSMGRYQFGVRMVGLVQVHHGGVMGVLEFDVLWSA